MKPNLLICLAGAAAIASLLMARVAFPASAQPCSFVAKLDPKMNLTELVLRSAQRRVEEARASHSADAAQQRLWMLSEQQGAAQAKKREEAERRAVDYARQPEIASA